MEADEFSERLARIRQRFATTLNSKVDDNFACLSKLSKKDADAIETIVVTHRKLHEMCGIAPSIGFAATGKAARSAEAVLREAVRFKRSLTPDELAAFIAQIDSLRIAAQSELNCMPSKDAVVGEAPRPPAASPAMASAH